MRNLFSKLERFVRITLPFISLLSLAYLIPQNLENPSSSATSKPNEVKRVADLDCKSFSLENIFPNFSVISPNGNRKGRNYALILNGDDSKLHGENVEKAYNCLVKRGYDDSGITVLSPTQFKRTTPFSENFMANYGTLVDRLKSLSLASNSNDSLFIYLTGHITQDNGINKIVLTDEEISTSSFLNIIKNTQFRNIIFVCDACYSGEIAQKFVSLDGNVLAIADTTSKYSTNCKSFSFPFWDSLSNGIADSNKDGFNSIYESFEYARKIHEKERKTNKCEILASGSPLELP